MMVFVMVYAMICYNISLNMGGMSNEVFLAAFHELYHHGTDCFRSGFLSRRTDCKEESIYDREPTER